MFACVLYHLGVFSRVCECVSEDLISWMAQLQSIRRDLISSPQNLILLKYTSY